LTVSTDDISLLELIGENSFSIEPIFENPIRPENEDDIALETENDELEAETLLI